MFGGERPLNPELSHGADLQTAFLGIDSLYLVMEYPHSDVFEFWASQIGDIHDPRLFEGIPYEDFLIRRGGLGYKLSVWINDARLFITDRVMTTYALMITAWAQCFSRTKWLWQYGDILSAQTLQNNILSQFAVFGSSILMNTVFVNRMDINLV